MSYVTNINLISQQKLTMSSSAQTIQAKDIHDNNLQKDAEHSFQQTKLQESGSTFKKRYPISSRLGSKQSKRPKTQVSRSFFKEIHEKMKQLELPLWNSSATTWVRDCSPKHKIPQAKRFTTLEEERRKNTTFLNLRIDTNIHSPDRGRTFAKSTRIDHFIVKNKLNQPSPANYRMQRFLSNSFYKSKKQLIESDIRQLSADKTQQLIKPNTEVCCILGNPQTYQGAHFHYENTKHFIDVEEQPKFDSLRGRTFSKTQNYHKQYLPHGKQFAYNEHFSEEIPGVGKYAVTTPIGSNKANFSMRKVLHRFNQRIKATPGAPDYINNSRPQKHSTHKTTISSGKRMDLAKPLNTTPGPAFYSITRYLQGKRPVP